MLTGKATKREPTPIPTAEKIHEAVSTISDWQLHYYQLLYFHEPPLTHPGKYTDPRQPIRVEKHPECLAVLRAMVDGHEDYSFAISTSETDEEFMQKIHLILDAIRLAKVKPAPSACCPLAETTFCVCYYSCKCPIHGKRCVGTHD